jgi:hypothetical protein
VDWNKLYSDKEEYVEEKLDEEKEFVHELPELKDKVGDDLIEENKRSSIEAIITSNSDFGDIIDIWVVE